MRGVHIQIFRKALLSILATTAMSWQALLPEPVIKAVVWQLLLPNFAYVMVEPTASKHLQSQLCICRQ